MSTPTIIRQGSSPLTRGKHEGKRRGLLRLGLIPAHAGKTGQRHASSSSPRTHPRSRRENSSSSLDSRREAGSSPLRRGKLVFTALALVDVGLIPAHAGKTGPHTKTKGIPGAHPRSRGENRRGRRLGWLGGGSSPLTRGKQAWAAAWVAWRWLIPAHAGKTCRCPGIRPSTWAHPRSRGENQRVVWRIPGLGGLIPAHAGKTD